ncbi:MAG: exodeoxyribonuclease V subunit alpha, partial [Burkholderiales bacterium]
MSAAFLGTRPHAGLAWLDHWVSMGWLRPLDRQFAAFLASQAPGADPLLLAAAAWTSHQLGRGHVCLDLPSTLADPERALSLPAAARQPAAGVDTPTPVSLLQDLTLARWKAALAEPSLMGGGPGDTPLVLDGDRLYLRRFWQYEQVVRTDIDARLAWPADAARPEARPALRKALQVLFPEAHDRTGTLDWQQVACALAARSHFAIVTGGPGTGKTTTVVRLLALLQHLALQASDGRRRLRIRLAAPTGKAAARLNASIAGA